ncbi:crossover junction endodeoxyribonuclease RuvC [Bradyrhizobium sp. USDA 4350]
MIDGELLTLDLATRTGFCVGRPDNPNPEFGHIVLPSTGDDVGTFAVKFEDWLTDFVEWRDIGLLVFEMPILPKQTQLMTVRKLTGLAWETEQFCRRRKIKCREGRASSVKKFFAGSGKAAKIDTMDICRRYGWNVKVDDEADACALWAYSVATFAPEHSSRFSMGPIGAKVIF